jgi:hypothetical protein
VDGGALALRMDIQYFHAQEPLSIRLRVLRSGGSYDATFGLDVFFGAVLDEVGERLAGVEMGKQSSARGWSGGGAGPKVSGAEQCCQRQQEINFAAFRAYDF